MPRPSPVTETGQGLLQEGGGPVVFAALPGDQGQVVLAAGHAFGVVRRLVVGQRLGVELPALSWSPRWFATVPRKLRASAISRSSPAGRAQVSASSSSAVEPSRSRWAWPMCGAGQGSGADGGRDRLVRGRGHGQRPVAPARPRSEWPTHQPEADQGAGQPQRLFDLPTRANQPNAARRLPWSASSRSSQRPARPPSGGGRASRPGSRSGGRGPPAPLRLAVGGEHDPELPDRLQQDKARFRVPRRVAADQVVVDQSRDRVED